MSKVVFFGSPHPAWISTHPKVCRIISTAAPEVVSFKADDNLKPGEVEWANYIRVRQTGYYCGCRVDRYLWRAHGGTLHPRSLESSPNYNRTYSSSKGPHLRTIPRSIRYYLYCLYTAPLSTWDSLLGSQHPSPATLLFSLFSLQQRSCFPVSPFVSPPPP